MKKLVSLVIFSLFLLSFSVYADTLNVNQDYLIERNIIVSAADRLVTLQNLDGGWDWIITDVTSPGGSTADNIEGVTGMGLLDAYSLTGNSDYIDAAKDTGDYLIDHLFSGSSVDITKRVNAFDIVFLYNLGEASGDNDYTDAADDLLDNVLTDDNYWAHHYGSFCSDSTGCTAQDMYDAINNRRGGDLGIMIWDLSPWVTAAELGGENSWASDMKIIMDDQYTNLANYTGDYSTIGLSGLVLAKGNSDAVDDLINSQYPDGLWDGWIQDTAYALMALKSADETDVAEDATDYLVSKFGYNGLDGWKEPGDEEYSEVTSEALQALFDFIYVPGTYYTIQDAVRSSTNGDTIEVSDGTYNENVNINKEIILTSISGPTGTIISGITGIVVTINSDNAVIDGFTVTNSGVPGTGIYSADHSDLLITNNIVTNIGNSNDDVFAQGIVIVSSASAVDNVVITNNQISDIVSGRRTGSSSTSSKGIAIGWSNGDEDITKLIIQNNIIFDIYADTRPWTTSTKGQGANGILINHGSSGDGQVVNAKILDNEISMLEGLWAHAIGLEGDTPNADVQRNNIINLIDHKDPSDAVAVMVEDNPSAGSVQIHFNRFENLNVGVLRTATSSGIVDAENNWWGSCDGPGLIATGSGVGVSDNVDYDPWIGICITDKIDDACAYDSKEIKLSAKLTSNFTINNVTFFVDTGETMLDFAGVISNERYNATLDTTGFGGKTIKWNVYAEDEFGNVYNNSWKEFYVRERTELNINPLIPDGLNKWYVTEPGFTLIKDPIMIGDVYYRWDGSGSHSYSTPFGLENIPNLPEESAGTLELTYWTDFGCGLEPEQSQTFYIDLTPPVITDQYPVEGELIKISNPSIRVEVDDIYGTNSGIKESSLVMKLDNAQVTPAIGDVTAMAKSLIYNAEDLAEGTHEVYVYAEDNAGWTSERTWQFNVDLGEIDSMTINSPLAGEYNERRQLLDITISETAEKLEYWDSADTHPKFKRLCKGCDSYSRLRSFKDGWHDLIIKATSYTGLTKEETVSFLIDSKKPKIHKTEPRRRGYATGLFTVQYTEDNLDYVKLFWKESGALSYNEVVLDGCEGGNRKECSVDISEDLALVENEIEYYFEISDGINNPVQSRVLDKLVVDITKPIITIAKPEATTYGRYVPFDITLSEDVKLYYKDADDSRYRVLCTRCSSYDKTKRFRVGNYNLEIKAVDKAGNEGYGYVDFIVV